MKKGKYWIIALTVSLLSGLWFWRYISLNNHYNKISDQTRHIYPAGEIVPFGEDFIDKDLCVNGYALRVEKFEIVDGKSYIDSLEEKIYGSRPDKIALVYITLFNEDSDAPGVMLPTLRLYGVDQYSSMNWNLLDALNPVLKGNQGIRLSAGTEYSLVLPYNLFRNEYGTSTWRNLNNYAFFLRITSFPTEKDIKVQ